MKLLIQAILLFAMWVSAATISLFLFYGFKAPSQRSQGELRCEGAGAVIINIAGEDYAVNGMAGGQYPPVQRVWNKETYPETDVDRLIVRGLTLCDWETAATKRARPSCLRLIGIRHSLTSACNGSFKTLAVVGIFGARKVRFVLGETFRPPAVTIALGTMSARKFCLLLRLLRKIRNCFSFRPEEHATLASASFIEANSPRCFNTVTAAAATVITAASACSPLRPACSKISCWRGSRSSRSSPAACKNLFNAIKRANRQDSSFLSKAALTSARWIANSRG